MGEPRNRLVFARQVNGSGGPKFAKTLRYVWAMGTFGVASWLAHEGLEMENRHNRPKNRESRKCRYAKMDLTGVEEGIKEELQNWGLRPRIPRRN